MIGGHHMSGLEMLSWSSRPRKLHEHIVKSENAHIGAMGLPNFPTCSHKTDRPPLLLSKFMRDVSVSNELTASQLVTVLTALACCWCEPSSLCGLLGQCVPQLMGANKVRRYFKIDG